MARTMARGGTHSGVRYPDIDPPAGDTRPGRAFTINEALLAMRWADLMRERGYRLTISHRFLEADEVLEVHILTCPMSISRLHWGSRVIWSTDCLGHMRPFATLADALLALAPLSTADRRKMLKAQLPAWLQSFPWSDRTGSYSEAPSWARWLCQIARLVRSI